MYLYILLTYECIINLIHFSKKIMLITTLLTIKKKLSVKGQKSILPFCIVLKFV